MLSRRAWLAGLGAGAVGWGLGCRGGAGDCASREEKCVPADAASLPVSSSVPASNAAPALAESLEKVRQKRGVPALGALLLKDGEIAAHAVTGVRKLGDPTPATLADKFHLGSCTKAMAATLLGMQIDAGKLTWETPLAEALPALAGSIHAGYRGVTVEQLLHHRGGFPGETLPRGKTFDDLHNLPGTPREQRRAYCELILAQGPARPPGTEFIYSNAGYTVAGAIVEALCGLSWEEQAQAALFGPLGMSSAGFGAAGDAAKLDQPWPHQGALFGRSTPVPPGPRADNPVAITPAGRVHSSLADWAQFARLHLGHRPALLRDETRQRLHRPPPGGDYACGWGLAERSWAGGTVLTHAGSNTLNYAVIWLAPAKNLALLAVSNDGNGAKACDDALTLLLS